MRKGTTMLAIILFITAGIGGCKHSNALFVNCTPTKKIFVYDLFGNFKRSFNHTENAEYLDVFNYDKDNLIRYDMSVYYKEGKSRDGQSYHAIISKQDGSITRNISIPFDIVKAPFVQKGDGGAVASIRPIIPYHDNWLLVEAYENDELKGELKEIAAKLNDESNPMIMLMKCKK